MLKTILRADAFSSQDKEQIKQLIFLFNKNTMLTISMTLYYKRYKIPYLSTAVDCLMFLKAEIVIRMIP